MTARGERGVRAWLARSVLAAAATFGAAYARMELVPDVSGGAGLLRNALLSSGVEVLVPPGPAAERCARIAAARPAKEPIEPRLAVRAPDAPGTPDAPRVVVGTASEALAARFARALGVDFVRAGEFRYLGQVFDRPDDVLVATWRDPDRPALPVTLFFGNDLARLALDLDAPLWGWKPNVRVLRGGETALEAPLELDGRCVKERIVRPAQARAVLRARYVPLPEDPAAFWGRRAPEVDDARARDYLLASANAAMRAATWASPGAPATPCELVLHAAAEDFERWTGVIELGLANTHTRVVHALLAPASSGLPDDRGAAVARATVEERLGPCFETWLVEGAPVWAAQRWYGRELGAWTGHLQRAGLALPVEALLDPNSDRRHSRHLLAPLRAELFGLVLEREGAERARALWTGAARGASSAELEAAFAARLEARAAAAPPPARAPAERRVARGLAGVVISPPAYERASAPSGYGSRAGALNLARARELGASVVAFTSSLAAEPDPAPRAGPRRDRRFGAVEGDVELFAALCEARATGATTALLPQLLSGAGGSWSGSWLRNGEADWRGFFGTYRRFATHYALVAELAGCDVLSLGGGLLETTRLTVEGRRGSAEELEWKSAGWGSVIRAARASFGGRLTFLAGSAEEVEKIAFWKELDLVGLEPRIEHRPQRGLDPRDGLAVFHAVLAATWRSAADVARAAERPLFVAPLSFPPFPSPEDARLGPGSFAEPARIAVFERCAELARTTREGTDAVLLGRWSTDAHDEGLGPRDLVLPLATARAAFEALARAGYGVRD
ncbi:MAG: hypothetical protein IPJ77_01810 [Planctomycetes bacterium]|nr:hypothetical protein [Planctomycetota bacterium]